MPIANLAINRAREREKVHLNNRLFPFLEGGEGGTCEEFHRLNKNYNEI